MFQMFADDLRRRCAELPTHVSRGAKVRFEELASHGGRHSTPLRKAKWRQGPL